MVVQQGSVVAMVTVVDHSYAKRVQMDLGNFTELSAGDLDDVMPDKVTLSLQGLPSLEAGLTKKWQEIKRNFARFR